MRNVIGYERRTVSVSPQSGWLKAQGDARLGTAAATGLATGVVGQVLRVGAAFASQQEIVPVRPAGRDGNVVCTIVVMPFELGCQRVSGGNTILEFKLAFAIRFRFQVSG